MQDLYLELAMLLQEKEQQGTPAGNAQRDDLTQAALAAGERMEVDFRTLYSHVGVPIRITVSVASLTADEAEVHIRRERVG